MMGSICLSLEGFETGFVLFSLLGGILLNTSRHYKTKPTHGIGRYKHLVKTQEVKGAGAL